MVAVCCCFITLNLVIRGATNLDAYRSWDVTNRRVSCRKDRDLDKYPDGHFQTCMGPHQPILIGSRLSSPAITPVNTEPVARRQRDRRSNRVFFCDYFNSRKVCPFHSNRAKYPSGCRYRHRCRSCDGDHPDCKNIGNGGGRARRR